MRSTREIKIVFLSAIFLTIATACNDTGFGASEHASLPQSDIDVPVDLPPGETPGGSIEGDGPVSPPPPKVEVPPSDIDSLVMKYGCSDSSDDGKKSNEKKIGICHVPSGNSSAAHMICVAVQGAVNGHQIDLATCTSPLGDYCGACK